VKGEEIKDLRENMVNEIGLEWEMTVVGTVGRAVASPEGFWESC
jgi:hypothetical protein